MADMSDATQIPSEEFGTNLEHTLSIEHAINCEKLSQIGKGDDYYNMKHKNRGPAFIFNHHKYDNQIIGVRQGAKKDASDLVETLSDLSFEVTVFEDCTKDDIFSIIEQASQVDYSNSDCILITIMTHGDRKEGEDILMARDYFYSVDNIWKLIAKNKTLAGKPKIFFIQACRGDKTDEGMVVTDGDEMDGLVNKTYRIPAMADFLIMYSTPEDHVSFRSEEGSWFIQSLCKQLKYDEHLDLVSILTLANRRMATEYISYHNDRKDLSDKKQIGKIVSTLTRFILLRKKKVIYLKEEEDQLTN